MLAVGSEGGRNREMVRSESTACETTSIIYKTRLDASSQCGPLFGKAAAKYGHHGRLARAPTKWRRRRLANARLRRGGAFGQLELGALALPSLVSRAGQVGKDDLGGCEPPQKAQHPRRISGLQTPPRKSGHAKPAVDGPIKGRSAGQDGRTGLFAFSSK
jgi:hypothetical protein